MSKIKKRKYEDALSTVQITDDDIEVMMQFVRRRHMDLACGPYGRVMCTRDPAWANIGYDTMQEILVEFVRMRRAKDPGTLKETK